MKWDLFQDKFNECLDICRELARYQFYWDQRTIWLANHADERDTPLYQERREKRRAMGEPWTAWRMEFQDAAPHVQDVARMLGPDQAEEIRTTYRLDFPEHRITALDQLLRIWEPYLTWNPEQPPF